MLKKNNLQLIGTLMCVIIGACQQSRSISDFLPIASITAIPALQSISATYTETVTPVPSPTSTEVSILPIDLAYSRLLDLLQSNEGCTLPCWWGLTPGKSTFVDAKAQLMPFMNIANFYSGTSKGGISLNYPSGDLLLSMHLGHYASRNTNVIELLYVSTQMLKYYDHGGGDIGYEDVYGASSYSDILNTYTLPEILSFFGPPTNVLIRAELYETSPSPELMIITVMYPEQGVFVRYTMPGERKSNQLSGCPLKAFITLWLVQPTSDNNYQDILSLGQNWEGDSSYIKSLEDATQMTIDEFYQSFSEPTDECLQTPLDIWPIN